MPIDGHRVRPALCAGPEVSCDRVKAIGVAAIVPPVSDYLWRLRGQLVTPAPAVLLVVHVVVLVAGNVSQMR